MSTEPSNVDWAAIMEHARLGEGVEALETFDERPHLTEAEWQDLLELDALDWLFMHAFGRVFERYDELRTAREARAVCVAFVAAKT